MGHMVGFVVIVILYAVIGLLAAAGAIVIGRRIFVPKAEQILYAMFLILIAAFYLAFTEAQRTSAHNPTWRAVQIERST